MTPARLAELRRWADGHCAGHDRNIAHELLDAVERLTRERDLLKDSHDELFRTLNRIGGDVQNARVHAETAWNAGSVAAGKAAQTYADLAKMRTT